MGFDYSGTEAWETSTDEYLPKGNHICFIRDPRMGDPTDNGNQRLQLKVENNQGSLPCTMIITEKSIGKVIQLFEAAGQDRPRNGEFDDNTGRLSAACCARLDGKQVGVVAREEESYKDPTRMIVKVRGFVPVAAITGGTDNRGLPGSDQTAMAGVAADDDIPF